MKRALRALLMVLLLTPAVVLASAPQEGLREWLSRVDSGLAEVVKRARAGNVTGARSQALKVYLDQYEVIEGWYGPGGRHAVPALAESITRAENVFHVLLQTSSASEMERAAAGLRQDMLALQRQAIELRVPLYPDLSQPLLGPDASASAQPGELRTPEIRKIAALVSEAERAFASGRRAEAVLRIEEAYLEGFEPLESRLPGEVVGGIERTIHLQLRPALKGNASGEHISRAFRDLHNRLGTADVFLARGGGFWFGVFNSFVIIVREGLEAVLLIAALLAYLGAVRAGRRERSRIWLGAGAGVTASVATWILAATIIPLGGASRELVEGITALVAVGVLLYVSHWLFQKTYIHDWKAYLRDHLGGAISRGSGFAMMGLAFAAVYREGFETVLFYQALLMDAGGRAVLSGFVPGMLVIAAVGWAIIRAGMKLPLKRVFAVTNSVLLYLAFVFLGKGIYNLQESGAFAAHPIPWLPSHPLLQQVFGFYPLMETLLAQLGLALLLTAALVVYRRQLRRRQPAAPQGALVA